MSLERRYRALLHAYPRAYRARRADEITATYLELAGPARRWPRPGDVADVLRGGIRERLRANAAGGAVAGLRLAATLALCGSAALAGRGLFYSLPMPGSYPPPAQRFGPFATMAVLPAAAWVLAGLSAAASTRLARALTGVALLLTLAVVPAAALTGRAVPWLTDVIPQVALGLVALALPARRGWLGRVAPALAGPVTPVAVLAWNWLRWPALMRPLMSAPLQPQPGGWGWTSFFHWYPWVGYPAEEKLAVLLIGGTVAADLIWVVRWRDGRGLWAALLLLPPAALLWLLPHAYPGDSYQPWHAATFAAYVTAASAAVVLLAVKLNRLLVRVNGLPGGLAGLLTGRLGERGHSQGQCPACGQPLPSRQAGLLPAVPADQQRGMETP